MTIHKWTKLTPVKRREIADKYFRENIRISVLARTYQVSRNTIYNVIRRAKIKDFSVHKSINKRYRTVQYGLRRLAKVERELEKKLAKFKKSSRLTFLLSGKGVSFKISSQARA